MTAMTAASDPNWLLSSTAQSAAALVAIIGGFLAARVLAFNSDKEATGRRLRSTASALESAEREEAAASAALTRFEEEQEAELKRREEEAVEQSRGGGIPIGVWSGAASIISVSEQQEGRDLAERKTAAASRVQQLEAEREQVERELASLRVPSDLDRGFRVLLFFALTGVVFPIVLMATQPDEVSLLMRALVVIGFVAGLVGLAGFIGSVIATARGRRRRFGRATGEAAESQNE